MELRSISQKWFAATTPVNFVPTKATITALDEETITVAADYLTETDVVIEIIVAAAKSKPLAVALADGTITVTLGTTVDDIVTADDTKNTLALIATEISKLDGFKAVASKATSIIDAATEEDIAFVDGNFGTPCVQSGVVLKGTEYYYVCTKADNTVFNDGWRRFTLASY